MKAVSVINDKGKNQKKHISLFTLWWTGQNQDKHHAKKNKYCSAISADNI